MTLLSDTLAEAYLAHHFAFRPIDASFMGVAGHDDRLPDASAGAAAAERAGIAALLARVEVTPEPESLAERIDLRIVRSQLLVTEAALDAAPRFHNPAWYTGEAAFAIIGLLLPSGRPTPQAHVRARLLALPRFLTDGLAQLESAAAPRAVTERAQREAAAAAAFLRDDLSRHADWDPTWAEPAGIAAQAFDAFGAAIEGLADHLAAGGRAYLELLMREAHGLAIDADEAVLRAQAEFDRLGVELVRMAAANDPTQSWQAQVESLSDIVAPSPEAVIDLCRKLDARAVGAAKALVTPATDYGLDYRWLSPCFENVARVLYFLPYRSPPAFAAGAGSTYWVTPPGTDTDAYLRGNSETNVKVIHAVHHGSIGHHTQNARARVARSTLARIAGTDCALGIAFLSSGTMVEGWACYVQDLLREAPGFYAPEEEIFLTQQQRRNAASVLVDIKLHTGAWSPAEAATFYRDEANFAPSRVDGEVTRNAMLPGTRLMYWLGTEQILALRERWKGDVRDFHDMLIGYGNIPVAWAGEEMARAGLLR